MEQKENKVPLTKEERKQIQRRIREIENVMNEPSTQNILPFSTITKDGILIVPKYYFGNTERLNFYSKTLKFGDINYQLASDEEQSDIFQKYCDILNYFDNKVKFQFTFESRKRDTEKLIAKIEISPQEDDFNEVRKEYSDMQKSKLMEGNNGNELVKFLTFGIHATNIKEARMKLNSLSLELMNLFKKASVEISALNCKERLEIFYRALNPYRKDRLSFNWDKHIKNGTDIRDYIVPSSTDFESKRDFELGDCYGSVCQIDLTCSELKDRILFDFLNENHLYCINIHVQSFDHSEGVKVINNMLLNKKSEKADMQRKIRMSGGDPDNISEELLEQIEALRKFSKDLKTKDERLFNVTLTVRTYAHNKKQLRLQTEMLQSICQINSCRLRPIDKDQENALCSSLPIGVTKIKNKRSLHTSSLAVFVPFTSRELFHINSPRACYYGLNALTRNLIFADKNYLKNPNSLILGKPGCFTGDTKIQLANGSTVSLAELCENGKDVEVKCFDNDTKEFTTATGTDPRISGEVSELCVITLENGKTVTCTPNHLILNADNKYIHAKKLKVGNRLSGKHTVSNIETRLLEYPVKVYDITVEEYCNFILDNGLIVHNSGKSFAAKREIVDVFLKTNDDIFICDPEAEFPALVNELHGQVVELSATSNNFINPMDIICDKELNKKEDPIPEKCEYIKSLMELIVGGAGLSSEELSLIDRASLKIYTEFLENNPTSDKMPILEDLYNELLKYGDITSRLTTSMEMYIYGTQKLFNNRTNIDINNRVVCFDIKKLRGSLEKLGMLIVQETVWNRVSMNRQLKKYTRFYIDEFHLLLGEKQTAKYCAEIWKRFRKWRGIPCGITQNVQDFLESTQVQKIFGNTDFIYLLDQAPDDRDILMDKLKISEQQAKFIENSGEGCGLIIFNMVDEQIVIPFMDEFPKNTILYKLMTTKASDDD